MISIKKVLEKASLSVVPCGGIISYYGTTAPSGFLACDGSTFDTAKYSKLYSVLGSDTLPDLRNRFVVGSGSTYALNATGGEATHTLTVQELPPHMHKTYWDYYNVGSSGKQCLNIGYSTNESFQHWTDSTLGNNRTAVTANQPHNNMPPYRALMYIISTGGKA